jgi:prepilin-type processing-associated H-X9-DG protein
LVPAVQAVREAAARTQCQSQIRELGIAVHSFNDANKVLPPYFGIFPAVPDVYQWSNTSAVYGSWFVHLLPYVEQAGLYQQIASEIQSAAYNQDQCVPNPPGWQANCGGSPQTSNYNGHSYTAVPCSYTCNGTYQTNGIWIAAGTSAVFPILQCPSDPTLTPSGLLSIYGAWGSTNYLANFNAWAYDLNRGLWQLPQTFSSWKDGTSNTVMFGEGYATCDGLGRIALYSWWYHNFGLDWYQMSNQNMFQDNPLIEECDNWRAQSGHDGGMNVCLGDGSVRVVHPSISQSTWANALLPRDGQALGSDW